MISIAPAEPVKPRLRVPASSRAMASTAGAPRRTSYSGAGNQAADIAFWQPTLKSADADTIHDAAKLRARARDLVRNHPFAKQALRASRLGVIGKKLRYSCRPDWRFLGITREESVRWGQEYERLWETYAHGPGAFIDAGRRLNFTQLMGLGHDCLFTDGEALGGLEWDERRKWRTCLQLVDVDRLSNPNGMPETVTRKGGVELDQFQAPVGYYIRRNHPGDIGVIGSRPWVWDYVPRETQWGRAVMIHAYEMERPGQTRGVTAFASTLTAMKQGQEYTSAALAQQIKQASYAAVLTSQANYKDALELVNGMDPTQAVDIVALAEENMIAAMEHHERVQFRFNGKQVPVLWPGEKFELVKAGEGAAQIGEFQSQATREYAAGTGTNPVEVSQDYSNVNYSSAKMAAAVAFRHYEARREQLLYQFGLPIVGAFLEEVVHAGFPLPKGIKPYEFYDALPALIAGKFLTQGAPMLDPVKERQGQMQGYTLGVETLQDIAAEEGVDYYEQLEQQARETQERMALGLPLPPAMGFPPPMPPAPEDAGDGGDAPAEDAPAEDAPSDG